MTRSAPSGTCISSWSTDGPRWIAAPPTTTARHNLAFASEKFLEAFGGLFHAFADNWCGVVVDAVEERLNVEGFRADAEAAETDATAWAIWQRNALDAQSQLAHQEALISGCSYAVVWPDDNDRAEVMVESAVNTIVENHPKIRTRRTAALRCWLDDDQYEHAELFLPDAVYLFRTTSKRTSSAVPTRGSWIVDPDAANVDAQGAMANPLGVVPVVTFHNRPRLYVSRRARFGVHSELAAIMPLQDAVNKLMADMLVASEFAGYPQRWATGYEPQVDRDTGAELPPPFKPGAGKTWVTDDPASNFGQFAAADLGNFVTAVDMVIQHVASISRTPPHYLNASADRLSGESIKAAETGLVAKTKRRMRYFGEAWEEVMRLAGKIEGAAELADATAMEVVWSDPESRTEAEQTDAAMKKQTLGVPNEQLWEDLGYSPTQRSRFRAMRAQEAFLRPAPAPPLGPLPTNGVVEPATPVV